MAERFVLLFNPSLSAVLLSYSLATCNDVAQPPFDSPPRRELRMSPTSSYGGNRNDRATLLRCCLDVHFRTKVLAFEVS